MSAWHILDVGSIWMKEFASALAQRVPVVAWQPRMLATGIFQDWACPVELRDPPLNVLEFPLQRGYSRAPLRWAAPFENSLLKRLREYEPDPARSPLVCTTPFYAPLAELWPGPVAYYSTDLTSAYEGLDAGQVTALERRMCRVARRVYPNSKRISLHLIEAAGCDPAKIVIVPNATRRSNLAEAPRRGPGELPADVKDLPRPIAGVLGDLSGNMDWELIAESIQRTPGFCWLFVGPAHRPIADGKQRRAREWVREHARFVGAKLYGELQAYARCVDVAVLPYRLKEPTYSGSSTRFYEHLAALRPMVATRGFAELLEKEPLLKLIDTAEELATALTCLHEKEFEDGLEDARWRASREGVWEERARRMSEDMCATLSTVEPLETLAVFP